MAAVGHPLQHVCLDELVVAPDKPVSLHVATRPVERRPGEVHRGGEPRAAVRRVAACRAGVGKEVEEASARRALHELAHHGAGLAVVQEEPAVQALGEVDLKGEAALVHEVRPAGQLHASVTPARGTFVASRSAASLSPAVCVLRAAACPRAHTHVHVGGVHVQNARRYGQHVEKAPARKARVHVARRGVLGDVEPAARRGRPAVQVNRDGVVRQVGVVDAVAAHILARSPLGAELGHLGEASGKLVRCPHQHGNAARVSAQLHQRVLRRE